MRTSLLSDAGSSFAALVDLHLDELPLLVRLPRSGLLPERVDPLVEIVDRLRRGLRELLGLLRDLLQVLAEELRADHYGFHREPEAEAAGHPGDEHPDPLADHRRRGDDVVQRAREEVGRAHRAGHLALQLADVTRVLLVVLAALVEAGLELLQLRLQLLDLGVQTRVLVGEPLRLLDGLVAVNEEPRQDGLYLDAHGQTLPSS